MPILVPDPAFDNAEINVDDGLDAATTDSDE